MGNGCRVLQLVRSYHDRYRKVLKSYKGRQNNKKYKSALNHFHVSSRERLFDIAACKCTDFAICHCDKVRKVPVHEQSFLTDQRTLRNMIIGEVDYIATNKLHRQLKRKAATDLRAVRNKKSSEEAECEDGDFQGLRSCDSSDR